MDTLGKIQEITLRLDHLDSTGEWLARALVHSDPSCSQAGSMIMALAEDIREKLISLVAELEEEPAEILPDDSGQLH